MDSLKTVASKVKHSPQVIRKTFSSSQQSYSKVTEGKKITGKDWFLFTVCQMTLGYERKVVQSIGDDDNNNIPFFWMKINLFWSKQVNLNLNKTVRAGSKCRNKTLSNREWRRTATESSYPGEIWNLRCSYEKVLKWLLERASKTTSRHFNSQTESKRLSCERLHPISSGIFIQERFIFVFWICSKYVTFSHNKISGKYFAVRS